MNKRNTQTLFALLCIGMIAIAMSACGAEDSTEESTDTFAQAVPSSENMELSMGETSTTQQELGVAQQAIVEEEPHPRLERGPGALRQHTENVLRGVHNLVSHTHANIDRLIENTEPIELSVNNLTCKQWEAEGQRLQWKLTSCSIDRQNDRFAIKVEASALENDDFKVIARGNTVRLNPEEGRRRSKGKLAYNLDNLAEVSGGDFSGKLAIGYHAAQKGRKMNIGMRNVQTPAFERPLTALYKFTHVKGKGGSFRFLTQRDILTFDDNGEPVFGQDETPERSRAAVAWSTTGAARGVFSICEGTLGEGQCVRHHQCWTANGEVTFEEVVDGDPNWEPTSCEEVFEDLQRPPREEEVGMPGAPGEEPSAEIPASNGENA